MNTLKHIAGVFMTLMGAALLLLVGWDLVAPWDDSLAAAPTGAGVLSSLVLGALWLAMGLWLLRAKRVENRTQ